MNLTIRPWIQAINAQNRLVELSLTETLLNAHTIIAIHGQTSLERIALFRLLMSVLYRACRPETETQAQHQYQTGKFDAARIQAYLATWWERFNLFDPIYPFFQVADPPVSLKRCNINRLFLNHSTGIKGTLHSHIHDSAQLDLTPAQAARAVVTAQAFLTAGGNSGRPGLMFRHTPPLQQTNFILQGPTLFHTLWLHLFPKEAEQNLTPFFPDVWPSADDCPVWERDHPEQPFRQQPQGPLDALTYPGRLIKLLPELDQMTVNGTLLTQGLWIAPNVPRFDPLAAYRLVKSKNKPLVVYPVKTETGFLEAVTLFDPHAENLAWPAYTRWRKLVKRGVLQPDKFQFIATGVECDPQNVALTRRIYDYRLPLPGDALLDETQLMKLQQQGQALETWSRIGVQALQAGVQTLHPSRQRRFQRLPTLLPHQLRQMVESRLPLALAGQEPFHWEAVIRHLVEQQTTPMLPVAAQAAARDKLNHLCAWQRKVKQEADEYANEPSQLPAATGAAG